MPGSFAVWNSRPVTADTGINSSASAGQLGKQDFLNLLAAQLRQQNPLEPLDSKDFMAQTAQFYTLEQLQQLNSAFTQSRELGALSQASGLIGKAVTAVDANNQRIDGIVEEVTLQNGQPLLLVDGIAISLDDIVVIRQAAGSGQLADDETPVDDGPVDSVGAADN